MFVLAQYVVIGLAAVLYLSGAFVLISGGVRLSDWGGGPTNNNPPSIPNSEENAGMSFVSPTRPTYFFPASESCAASTPSATSSSPIGAREEAPTKGTTADQNLRLTGKDARRQLFLQPVCLN